jgi:hypothetical protein
VHCIPSAFLHAASIYKLHGRPKAEMESRMLNATP